MKTWTNELNKVESLFFRYEMKSWKKTLDIIQKYMTEYPDDVDLNIRVIYILHNILVEENYPDTEHDFMAQLLKKYFGESYQKFSENSEYLFFIGKILPIAEWYFGLDDDMKAEEERLAFKMQKKAFDNEPTKELYKWGYMISKNNKKEAFLLSKKILYTDSKWLEWLKSKGFPGQYIQEGLEYSYINYKDIQ